jgi:hypothetical protein
MTNHLAKLVFLFSVLGVPIDVAPTHAPAAASVPARARRVRAVDSCVELPAAPVVAVPSCSGGAAVAP